MNKIQCDKEGCRVLRLEMNRLLASLESSHGVKISVGDMRYSPEAGTITIKAEAVVAGGKGLSTARVENVVKYFGLMKEVTVNGIKFELIDYKPRSYRFPYVVAYNGKRFKWTENVTKIVFGQNTPTAARESTIDSLR